jgi:hypothetical protein
VDCWVYLLVLLIWKEKAYKLRASTFSKTSFLKPPLIALVLDPVLVFLPF